MFRTSLILLSLVGSGLMAQAPAAASLPALKWRGSLWASGQTGDRSTADGAAFLRGMEPTASSFALDGVTLGADLDLGQGWAFRATLLGGHAAKVLNATCQETGTVAFSEAQLVWTGGADTLRLGRMNTFLGMEFLDGAANLTASRGLLFTYADPFGQVGVQWHHAFSPSWSSDVFLFNGEDRVHDNNKGKTAGLGLTYNHGGSADTYVTLQAYRGAEQDTQANPGAEGRKRDRLASMGQWIWGGVTLQWEATWAREVFAPGVLDPKEATATWFGAGAILKVAFTPTLSGFARAERLADDSGVRLGADAAVKAVLAPRKGLDLVATNLSLGLERTWGKTFTRLEVRQDRLNKDVLDRDLKPFSSCLSGTLSVGTSF